MRLITILFLLIIISSCQEIIIKDEITETINENMTENPLEEKVYPFMELKTLYNENWKGEMKGNDILDGKEVIISGIIYSKGSISSLQDDDSFKVTGAKVRFKEKEDISEEDFSYDVACIFNAEFADKVDALKKGSFVLIKGIIYQQQWYIEPSMKYTVLELKDCEIVKH